jgi:hypothetical protein
VLKFPPSAIHEPLGTTEPFPMALIFLGHSTCALCGQLLMPGEEVTGLPAISNTNHPLYKYFDCGFHLKCFERWNKKEEALNLIEEEKQQFVTSDYYREMAAKHGKPKWLDEQQ